MEDHNDNENKSGVTGDVRTLVRGAIEEFLRAQHEKSEPAYKNELGEERKRREQLERRVNELVEENRRGRMVAEEIERGAGIRAELQRMGVAKVDLAFRAVRDDIVRTEDGRLVAKSDSGEVAIKEYLSKFLQENPELLPGRIPGGSGAGPGQRTPVATSGIDINNIRPGMSPEELDKVRQEVARLANQAMLGS